MDDYAGRVLANRYRLPLPPADEYELAETRALDTYSGQEVLVRQVPLPEVVDAELADGGSGGAWHAAGARSRTGASMGTAAGDPVVHRAMDAATRAAQIPDHPRLDQVFQVFVEDRSLWIVSELVSGRTLAALLAERALSPHRAAEIAADILTALRAVHAHGWTHRNITPRTVVVCDDGRAVLTGLASGAAEEALCGYDPVPDPRDVDPDLDPALDPDVDELPGHGDPEAADQPAAADAAEDDGGPDDGYQDDGDPDDGYQDDGDPDDGYQGGGERDSAGGAHRDGRDQAPRGPGGHQWDHGESAERPAAGTASAPAAPSGGQPGWTAFGADAGDTDLAPWQLPGARGGAIAAYRAGARAGAARTSGGGTVPQPRRADTGAGQWLTEPAARTRTGDQVPPAFDAGRAPRQRAPWEAEEWTGPAEPVTDGRPWGEAEEDGAPDAPDVGEPSPEDDRYRGPETALAAERARQARMVVVGPVTERWAPEQAGPVYDNWRLAPPVGPAADLWAVGVLLFRAVQGHSPYPEDSVAELVQMVCAETPAYAEECGALRPVVESLMRQDPTERPEFEELRGWLRSLIRSAPEPDVGSRTVTVPSHGALSEPADPRRLPILRRRGELVRRWWLFRREPAPAGPGRHKRSQAREQAAGRAAAGRARSAAVPVEAPDDAEALTPEDLRAPRRPRPRHLGRVLLTAILLGLAAAMVYAMVFMPDSHDDGAGTGSAGSGNTAPEDAGTAGEAGSGTDTDEGGEQQTQGSQVPRSTEAKELAKGFTSRKDPAGFEVAVFRGWERVPPNDRGQVRYLDGDFELVVVSGRDPVDEYGRDPMAYQQQREPELAAFRASSWASSSGLRRIDVGDTAMAEGRFVWKDSSGRKVCARNQAMILNGRYHLVQVIGPADQPAEVDRYFDQAASSYRTLK